MLNVLSLFDGISGAQVALNRAKIKYTNYYASEIDPFAIKITQKNYPSTIQLGDIRGVKSEDLPTIDLLVGGSPCQGFSCAGRRLNFEDPRSKLFWEYVRLLKESKPKYFLLENVVMPKKWQDVISNALGTSPIEIDSALVSAQMRKRLYWSNLFVPQLVGKQIYLKDIIEHGEADRDKAYCLTATYKKPTIKEYFVKHQRQVVFEKSNKIYQGKKNHSLKNQYPLFSLANFFNLQGEYQKSFQEKVRLGEYTMRKLTPLECERLQTYPDNYTQGGSNTQRVKALGNSFTVDVIAHFFKSIEKNNLNPRIKQLSLFTQD